jgi:hypothetical protein
MDSLSTLPWKSKSRLPVIGSDERLLRAAHSHWMKKVVPVVVYVLLLVFGAVLFFVAATARLASPDLARVLLLATLVSLTVVHHWFFHFLLSENVTDVILTNKRILRLTRSLWFVDTMDEIVLVKIKMVEVQKRGILRRLLNYGDLWFDTGGGQHIPFIPAPKVWAQDVERNMRIG